MFSSVGRPNKALPTKEQREGIREFLSHFLPLEWESFTEGPDATIEWKAETVRAEAKLDGGKAAEVVLTRFSGASPVAACYFAC